MKPERLIETNGDPLVLRAQTPDDGDFLARLFAASRAPMFLAAGMPQAQVDTMMDFQHRAQSQGYRGQFPDARFLIVERAGAPIGRLVENDEAEAIYIVDIAVAPDLQRQGVAATLIGAMQRDGAARGRGVRAQVYPDNLPSLALFRRMGFSEAPGAMQIGFFWRP